MFSQLDNLEKKREALTEAQVLISSIREPADIRGRPLLMMSRGKQKNQLGYRIRDLDCENRLGFDLSCTRHGNAKRPRGSKGRGLRAGNSNGGKAEGISDVVKTLEAGLALSPGASCARRELDVLGENG